MKALTRVQMKAILGGYAPIEQGECSAQKCTDGLAEGKRCGGQTGCKCETACIYCTTS